MHWPQITLIVLFALSVGVAASKHGEPRDEYNVLFSIIRVAILTTLLHFGGFFSQP